MAEKAAADAAADAAAARVAEATADAARVATHASAARAAAHASACAAASARVASARATDFAIAQVYAASARAASADKKNRDEVILAIRRDIDHLLKLAKENKWNDNTPVGPEVFGPMWPNGAPPNWPEEKNSEGCELVFEIIAPDNASDAEIKANALKLVELADEYHRSMGGHGLKIETLEMYGDVPIEVGVET
jgi:hypothetical protein